MKDYIIKRLESIVQFSRDLLIMGAEELDIALSLKEVEYYD